MGFTVVAKIAGRVNHVIAGGRFRAVCGGRFFLHDGRGGDLRRFGRGIRRGRWCLGFGVGGLLGGAVRAGRGAICPVDASQAAPGTAAYFAIFDMRHDAVHIVALSVCRAWAVCTDERSVLFRTGRERLFRLCGCFLRHRFGGDACTRTSFYELRPCILYVLTVQVEADGMQAGSLVCIITRPSLASTVKRAAGRSERQQLFTAQHLQHFIRQHAEISGGITPTTVQRQRLARVVSVFDFLCAFADNRAK